MTDDGWPMESDSTRLFTEANKMAEIDLEDAIDVHVHTAPDVYPRSVDDLELAREAEKAGMRALLLKSHHTLTADRASLAARQVSIDVFGGLAMNLTVGGLNPVAVETAIAFGARQIWMPTIHARHCLETAEAEMFRAEARKGRPGLSVLADDGEVSAELSPILEMIRDADIILGTGHLAPAESLALLRKAKAMGVSKLLITHPLMPFTFFSIDQMREATAMGAVLEFDALSCRPDWPGAVSAAATAEAIRAVGPEHCVLGSDGGQKTNPHPPAMLLAFAESLRAEGLAPDELKRMLREVPARLLDLSW